MSLVSPSLWFYSSCEFPSQWKRHDKFFPAFPQSKAFQILPQAVCQPSNPSVSHTALVLQECRTQVRLGVSPFDVSDFICNASAGRKRMWKNRTCDGMLNIFSWKAIILLVYIAVHAVKLCNLRLNEPTCVDRILLYIIFFPPLSSPEKGEVIYFCVNSAWRLQLLLCLVAVGLALIRLLNVRHC